MLRKHEAFRVTVHDSAVVKKFHAALLNGETVLVDYPDWTGQVIVTSSRTVLNGHEFDLEPVGERLITTTLDPKLAAVVNHFGAEVEGELLSTRFPMPKAEDSWHLRDDHPALMPKADDHASHYGGEDNPYEAIKVIEAWALGFCLGNAIKYICRAGKKAGAPTVDDLKKARWYLDRRIYELTEEKS